MAPVIDATKSGAAANCYVTLAAADAEFDLLYLADEWAELDETTRKRILITASRMIDRLPISYPKYDADTPQKMAFPVNTQTVAGADAIEGGWDEVQAAVLAQALYLMRYGESAIEAQTGAVTGLKSETLGKVSTSKAVAGTNPFRSYDGQVYRLLEPFLNLEVSIGRG